MEQCTHGREGHCWFAEGDVSECKCACGGANHGMALEKSFTKYQEAEDYYNANADKTEGEKSSEQTEQRQHNKNVKRIADDIAGGNADDV